MIEGEGGGITYPGLPRNYISRRLAPASLTKRENSKFESKLSYSEFSLFVTPAGFKPTTF